jgi:hypothetical protein
LVEIAKIVKPVILFYEELKASRQGKSLAARLYISDVYGGPPKLGSIGFISYVKYILDISEHKNVRLISKLVELATVTPLAK